MRYRELIESPNAYLPMFNGVPVDRAALVQHIRDVETAFRRQDRITWYLRYSRIHFMAQAANKGQQVDDKLKRKALSAINPTITWDDACDAAGEAMGDFQTLKHFVDMSQITAIQNVMWVNQTPYALVHHLDDLEDAWKEKVRETTVEIRNGDQLLIDFKNGWAWWLLDRGYCRDEADAMGHCGNAGAASGDRILSLRQQIHDNRWEPHLTFILDSEGFLGEMKGKGNEKPVETYHKYILALLRNPIVKGVKGGGYLPENNFAIGDLDRETRQKLLAEKPELKEVHDLYTDWWNEKDPVRKAALLAMFKPRLERDLDTRGFSYDAIDWNRMEIIINQMKLDSYVVNHPGHLAAELYHLIDTNLEDMLADMPDAPEHPERIAHAVREEYLMPLFKESLNMGVSFKFQGTGYVFDETSKMITTEISIRAYVYEEDENINGADDLDSVQEYDDYFDDKQIINELGLDDVSEALVTLALDKHNKKKKANALTAIVQHYENIPEPFNNDPNQHDLFR